MIGFGKIEFGAMRNVAFGSHSAILFLRVDKKACLSESGLEDSLFSSFDLLMPL